MRRPSAPARGASMVDEAALVGCGAAIASGCAWARTCTRFCPSASRHASTPFCRASVQPTAKHAKFLRFCVVVSTLTVGSAQTLRAQPARKASAGHSRSAESLFGTYRGCGDVQPAKTCATAQAQPARATRRGWSLQSSFTTRLSARALSRCAAPVTQEQGSEPFLGP